MTLRRRLITQWTLLLVCLTLTAEAGVWGVGEMRSDFSVALTNYERLRQLYQIGFHLQSARMALSIDFPDAALARLESRRAQQTLSRLAPEIPVAVDQRQRLEQALEQCARRLAEPRPSVAALDLPLSRLSGVVDALRLQIEEAQQAADRRQRETRAGLLGVAGLLAVAGVVLGWLQFRAVMNPLRVIGDGVRRVAGAQFDPPIDLPGSDREFDELATDFNRMAGQLRSLYDRLQERVESATRRLVQSERLAGVGFLAAGVAHEINNPLAIITGRLELLQARTTDPAVAASLKIAIEEAYRCKDIIDRMLFLARGPAGRRGTVDLGDVAAGVIDSVRGLPGAAGRAIDLTRNGPAVVDGDAGELRQVVLNLLINALDASAAGEAVTVRVEATASNVTLEVADHGRGMTGETLDRIFEPFYSARAGEVPGTGLGLSISKAIAESHRGTLEAHSVGLGQGSVFTLRLPAFDIDPDTK